MFKITQDFETKRFTVTRYINDGNYTRQMYELTNLTRLDVARHLQGRIPEENDGKFAYVVVKSGNGPAILTVEGILVNTPTKKAPVKELRNERPNKTHPWRNVLQRKGRRKVSH